jgi:glycosyltransferase involved in cell wall biosynthesis
MWTFVSELLKQELLGALDGPTRGEVERVARVSAPPLELPDVHEAVERVRRELGATRAAVVVGRLVASKRVDRAIEYVARVHDVDTLVVVGDGPERSRLERLARARGVDARFVGALDRSAALAWIGAAQELLHASTAEGLSTVVREAEALGTRIVRL